MKLHLEVMEFDKVDKLEIFRNFCIAFSLLPYTLLLLSTRLKLPMTLSQLFILRFCSVA